MNDGEGDVELRGLLGPELRGEERIWKYMAKRPAKNISSLPSHTMVPTDTMLGRVAGPEPRCTERDGAADAVATSSLWGQGRSLRSDPPCRMRP